MSKISGRQKLRARKREQKKSAEMPPLLQADHDLALAQVDASSQALTHPSEQTLLEEFFTSSQDAAINRFADAASTLLERSQNADKGAFLSCHLGDEEYGIDLNMAREILRPVELTPVPHSPAAVLGVMSLRGRVLPVVDLAMHLGLISKALPQKRGQRYVVLAYAGELVGFRVDRVDGVVSFVTKSIEAPPQDLAGSGHEYVFGIGRTDDHRMLLLLDLDLVVGELLPGAL